MPCPVLDTPSSFFSTPELSLFTSTPSIKFCLIFFASSIDFNLLLLKWLYLLSWTSSEAFFNSGWLSIYSFLDISYNLFSSKPNVNKAFLDLGEIKRIFLFVNVTVSKLFWLLSFWSFFCDLISFCSFYHKNIILKIYLFTFLCFSCFIIWHIFN